VVDFLKMNETRNTPIVSTSSADMAEASAAGSSDQQSTPSRSGRPAESDMDLMNLVEDVTDRFNRLNLEDNTEMTVQDRDRETRTLRERLARAMRVFTEKAASGPIDPQIGHRLKQMLEAGNVRLLDPERRRVVPHRREMHGPDESRVISNKIVARIPKFTGTDNDYMLDDLCCNWRLHH
jgi:hypothetical protein